MSSFQVRQRRIFLKVFRHTVKNAVLSEKESTLV